MKSALELKLERAQLISDAEAILNKAVAEK